MPIMGTYPCCGAVLMLELPDAQLPRFAPHNCDECGAKVWTWVTRLNPRSWTDEDFKERFEVDEENRTIEAKPDCDFDHLGEFYEVALALGLINEEDKK